ncbi:transmembrane protein 26 [Periplaneta americana]|uniref:transmembrane protein 26 n=1 Tax=Periplaneta americana TaxID=6978 RepID=UPI0037E9C94D
MFQMVKLIATFKAILTRVVFGAHGFIAIWQVTTFKKNLFYWYLSAPIIVLVFEGIFTLTIKDSQEWKWFCPSVFLYLSSVVPAIWLLELDKVDRRLRAREEAKNITAFSIDDLRGLDKLMGGHLLPPNLQIDTETWVTLIEQFLMLILIIGRWMLPKGELTRDQLSQLLLVYIGTAADIIEFFDSFKDEKIAQEPILVLLTLAIWSWSLLQFTVVLTATKSRKSRLTSTSTSGGEEGSKEQEGQQCCAGCCSIDVWGIVLNILLQDAPFLTFRLLLIVHYQIISYMNVFFTCKNTLVIVLQLYRLYVVHSETRKLRKLEEKQKKRARISNRKRGTNRGEDRGGEGISVISLSEVYTAPDRQSHDRRTVHMSRASSRQEVFSEDDDTSRSPTIQEQSDEEVDLTLEEVRHAKKKHRDRTTDKNSGAGRSYRQDTGYSTASSSHGSTKDLPREPASARRLRSKATMTSRQMDEEERV